MRILAFETSCDETSVAVVRDGRHLESNVVLSQIDIHALYGGVVPEIASRRHMEVISRLTDSALEKASMTRADVDAVAVTYAPGLIGALLVGVGFAKGVAFALRRPLIPVHHIRGHIAANYLCHPALKPPFLSLVVSGGHTLIAETKNYNDICVIGSTCDDAVGEAFDKVARVLGLGYPGGAALSTLAAQGRADAYRLPRPVTAGNPYDMSFSGLKTAALSLLNTAAMKGETVDKANLAASFEDAVCDVLVSRTVSAAQASSLDTVVLSGGVAANARLRNHLTQELEKQGKILFFPTVELCGDNAAMIAAQAFYEFESGAVAGMSLNGYANLCVSENKFM